MTREPALPAPRLQGDTAKQTSDNEHGEQQSAAGCRGRLGAAPACSPYGRDAFFISYKEITLMETLCSSGAAGSLLPTSAFPRTESGRDRSYRVEGGPGRGRPGHPSILGWGREWLRQLPAENKLCPETAPCPSHQ